MFVLSTMKPTTVLSVMGMAALAVSVQAASKEKIDLQIRERIVAFARMQQDPEKLVPPEILRKAEGLVLLERVKAGFIFAYEGGGGVAIVKDKKSGKWGPVAVLKAGDASLGFQAGGQKSFVVLVLMNATGTRLLIDSNMKIGVDARATAGPHSAGADANLSTDETPVLVYSDVGGLFAGASIQGGALVPDNKANETYYGQPLITMKEILFDQKVKSTEAAQELARKIEEYSKPAKKK